MANKLYSAYAKDPLNPQASVFVDVQTDIKTIIKNGILNGMPFSIIQNKTREVMENALQKIKSATLRADARVSLMQFANTAYVQLKMQFPNPVKAVAIYTLVKGISLAFDKGKTFQAGEMYIPKTNAEKTAFKELYGDVFATQAKGIPAQEFSKTYMKQVSDAMHKLADLRALDPNDVTGRNGLRNLAEMQVRYERHQEEIEKLKADGVKLVICSVHGDCSERCSGWQGRVYSLDGTYGITKDGRKYVPLEEATDVFYTTKAGKTYKNGLLGFNCRHKLYPYKEGIVAPYVSKAEQVRERAITQRQRELERYVVHWREETLAQKGNAVEYKKAKIKARYWFDEYVRFSKENGRAYYPDRVKVL